MNQIIVLDFGNPYNQDLLKVIGEQNIKVKLFKLVKGDIIVLDPPRE